MYVVIDLLNKCNLMCPSCAIGWGGKDNPHRKQPLKRMSPEDFAEVLDAVSAQTEIEHLCLYGYSEPLLHKDIFRLLDIVAERGLRAEISTNAMAPCDYGRLSRHPGLSRITISLSGFSPEVYQRGHRGGDFAVFKEHLDAMAAARSPEGPELLMRFHSYLYNQEDERKANAYCKENGLVFQAYPALLVTFFDDMVRQLDDPEKYPLSADERRIAERIMFSFDKCREFDKDLIGIPCTHQENGIYIAPDKTVYVCTAASRSPELVVGDILSDDIATLMERKRSHPLCAKCKGYGLHVRCTYAFYLKNFMEGVMGRYGRDEAQRLIGGILDNTLRSEDAVAVPQGPILLFGVCDLSRAVAEKLIRRGAGQLLLVDENPAKIGQTIAGAPVVSLDEALERYRQTGTFIVSLMNGLPVIERVVKRLREAGCRDVRSLVEFMGGNKDLFIPTQQ